MPTPAFRVTDIFYAKIKAASKAQNTSVSDFIRSCVEYAIDNDLQSSNPVDPLSIRILQEQLKDNHKQLTQKDEQISELHQLLAVSQKSIQQLTQQNQFLLEDKRKPLWRRLFRR